MCCRISKISNEVGRIDNFRALTIKLSFLPTELDIFDIRQHYVCILFIFRSLISIAVYGNGLAVLMTSRDHVDCVIKRDLYHQKMHSCSKIICGISFFVVKIYVVYHEKIYHMCYCKGIPLVER